MNHCRRCDSDYEKPGTCNCYAPTFTQLLPSPYVHPPTTVIIPTVWPSPATTPLPWVSPYWNQGGSVKYEGPPVTVWCAS